MKDNAVGGATIIANMDAQVVATIANNPSKVIIALGTNDFDPGDMGALQAEVEENLLELKTALPKASIYYMNVLPRWTDVGGGTEVDKSHIRTAIAAACTAKGVPCWDTYTAPWIAASDTYDGTHPNAGGHSKIAAQMWTRL